MFSGTSSDRQVSSPASSGRPQLTLAQMIVFGEALCRCFARPVFFAAVFAGLAWLGLFTKLYPFAHLVALAIFVGLFFDALGRAQHVWKKPSPSLAKRRVEEATGLTHRPLDVLGDRPVNADSEGQQLWQEHALRARIQTQRLGWPRWKMNFAAHDPYRLRYVAAVLLVVGLVAGWGTLGPRLIAAINPALGKLPIATATIDAWITPPDYTHLPPIMIATPAGDRFEHETITVPEGSVVHAHFAAKDGDAPVLSVNGDRQEFAAEDGKDFGIAATVKSGSQIAIRRGWSELGSWRIRVVPDAAPTIAFTDPPAASEHKDVRVAYEAKDDYGVTSVTLRMMPRETLFGLSADPVEFPLASGDAKELKRVTFQDLTASPRAGMMVDLQLIATDAAGHTTSSNQVSMTLPERIFFNPIARALVDERKKLLSNMFDANLRDETANLMASLARQPASINNDPVIMMALRAGAVRLVLDHERDSALSVTDILWQVAVHIEDGTMGVAEQNLRQAQEELADALDRNASEKEIQGLIDRLHEALARYLAELSTRVAMQPSPQAQELGQILGDQTNMLTPQDLDNMLDKMKDLSASGDSKAAQKELSKLQQILENVQKSQPQLNEQQQAELEAIKAVKAIIKDQQALLDTTFQKVQTGMKDKKEAAPLASAQKDLRDRLQTVIEKVGSSENLPRAYDAMGEAKKQLDLAEVKPATDAQNAALKALQESQQKMTQKLRGTMFALQKPGMGQGQSDPFGRDGNGGMKQDTSIKVPDHFEAKQVREILDELQRRASERDRPKAERDYFERLLQNF